MPVLNALGQPVGDPLPQWSAPPLPPHDAMVGRFCRLEPLAPHHAEALWESFGRDVEGRGWTYLASGPHVDIDALRSWLASVVAGPDPQFYAILVNGSAVGVAAYLRITPAAGTIEVGHIHFALQLARTPAATECMYLMMQRAFETGYRRYEWKCDSLNAPSQSAAVRLGFSYEGIFRQAMVSRDRNRDTAWFACLDGEWPALQQAYRTWLAPANFDGEGHQHQNLGTLTRQALESLR